MEFSTKNNITAVPQPPNVPDLTPCDFSLLPRFKVKLKVNYFETNDVIDAESQAVLSTLTEHDFQGTLGPVHAPRVTVTFRQTAAPAPGSKDAKGICKC
jgi:hypothetical protein